MSPLVVVMVVVMVVMTGGAWGRESIKMEPTCYPFNYTCGPITPSLPTSYEAHLEHVDLKHRTTHYLQEFYDYKADVLAVSDAWGSSLTHTIFFFYLNVAVFMTKDRGSSEGRYPTQCVVSELSHDALYHPFPGQNGSAHLVLAPSQALLFGADYRYSYVDNETVRGMTCNRWDACINNLHDSFYVEYYWSDPALVLDMYGYTSEHPVKMKMMGRVLPPQGATEPIEIDSLYSMALFDDKPDLESKRWAFEIPSGVYCEGLPSLKKPPARLSSVYSMRIEATLQTSSESSKEYVSTIKGWYDFHGKLTRADSLALPGSLEFAVAGLVQVAAIKDLRAGVEYIIDKTLGNCTTLAIPGGYDTFTTGDGHYVIKDPLMLLGLSGESNLTYIGMKYARGLPCDVWAGHMDLATDNGTIHDAYLYEIYFLQSGWTEDAGAESEHFPVPVLITINQDLSSALLPEDIILNLHQNIFKFEQERPLMSVYDITPCFTGHDHIRRFQIAFPGTYRDYFNDDPVKFTAEVRDGLLLYLLIPGIRLQHVLLEYLEAPDRLFCEFTLVDQPQVDMEMPPYVGEPLDKIVQNLRDAMDDLGIIIIDSQGNPIMMKAINDSLKEMYEDNCYSRHAHALHDPEAVPEVSPPPHHDGPGKRGAEEGESEDDGGAFFASMKMQEWVRSGDDKMYNPGDMAGMAVGMLLLGLLLGTVVTLIILNKMGLSSDFEFIPLSSRRQ